MLTKAVRKIARQQFHRSSAQSFLLPLDTEHQKLLFFLLAERLAVTHLEKKVFFPLNGLADDFL